MSKPHSHCVGEEALQRVLAAYGLDPQAEVRPCGGTASPKWAVASGAQQFLVRVRPAEFAGGESVRFDHTVLGRLREAGLPVPVPLAKSDGASWLRLDGRVWEVLHWIDGEPFDESDPAAVISLGAMLARFHGGLTHDIPPGKQGRLREDHPDLMEPYVAGLRKAAVDTGQQRLLDAISLQLDYVRDQLDTGLYQSLPHCVIHGDVHPGNVRFRGSDVAAIYDFDYMNVQARVRDVSDGLMFFAATRRTRLDPDDIRSLTQPFLLDLAGCRLLLRGYQRTTPLTDAEWEALPLLIRSRWLQMRLRGSRKVAQQEKVAFTLDRLFEVTDWLDRKAEALFDELRSGS